MVLQYYYTFIFSTSSSVTRNMSWNNKQSTVQKIKTLFCIFIKFWNYVKIFTKNDHFFLNWSLAHLRKKVLHFGKLYRSLSNMSSVPSNWNVSAYQYTWHWQAFKIHFLMGLVFMLKPNYPNLLLKVMTNLNKLFYLTKWQSQGNLSRKCHNS